MMDRLAAGCSVGDPVADAGAQGRADAGDASNRPADHMTARAADDVAEPAADSGALRSAARLGRVLSAVPASEPRATQPADREELRRGVVFGGGGVLGFAWMVGALTAVEEQLGDVAASSRVAVGTSAGSVVATLLGCGIPLAALRRHHQGVPAPGDPHIGYDHDSASGGPLPPRPGLRPAAPGLVLNALRGRGGRNPLVALTGLVPAGRGSLAPLHAMVTALAEETGHVRAWPTRPAPWLVAVDYGTGRRTVFRDGHPTRSRLVPPPGRGRRRTAGDGLVPALPYGGRPASAVTLADAVVASCSIPGWYPPVTINGHSYIDGGAASNASVDLLRGLGLDEVLVLAPMASTEPDRPSTTVGRMERAVRRSVTRHLMADVAELQAEGTRVTVVTPGPEDLAEMGVNLMDPARRTRVLDTAIRTTRASLRARRVRSVG